MFGFLKQRATSDGLIAICMQADGVCIARVNWLAGERPRLMHAEYQPWEQGVEPDRQLQRLAAQHQLKRTRCTTLLDESEYTLVLTEAPDVRPEELKTALRWRVKDLIDFHINDATLDVFELPGMEVGGRAREMYAVAARNEAIRRRVDQLHNAGINLEVIDIPEMAQRNLAALLPEDAQGVAALSFSNRGGLLTISKQGELYLSRILDVGLDQLTQSDGLSGYYDRVVLEIQRSLDYYESHFRQSPVQHLRLTSVSARVPEMLDYLRSNLSVSVSAMNLAEMIDFAPGAPAEFEGACLFTLGAALRREEKTL